MNRLVAACAVGLAFTAPAMSQTQRLTPYYHVVERGHTIKLGAYGSFAADCSPLGRATINLISAPQEGQVETEAGSDFPNYQTNNVRFRCDRIRGPQTILYYHASRDFVGSDTFTIEKVFPGGEAQQERWTVYVR